MKKVIKIFACVLAVFLFITGCSSGKAPADAPVEQQPDANAGAASDVRTDLIIGMSTEPVTLNAQQSTNTGNARILCNVFDRLLDVDAENNLIPNLAESWSLSDDNLTYTFHLRQDIKFHNGDPLTADDVKYSFDGAIASGFFGEVTDLIASTEASDPHTFVLTLKSPCRLMLNYVAKNEYFDIVNSKLATERGEDLGVNIAGAGTGPYKFVEWQTGVGITLEANEEYHRGAPTLKNVTFKFIPEASAGAIALETGDVDVYMDVSFVDVKNLESNSDLQVDIEMGRTHYYICVNMTQPPFDDIRVRQALAYAVNLDEFVMGALNGIGGVKTSNVVFPSSFGYSDKYPIREQNIEKAKALLAEAGYPNGLDVTMITNDGQRKVSTETLQGMLAQSGFNVTIELVDTSAMGERIGSASFEAMVMNQLITSEDAGADMVEKLVSTVYGNFGRYNNPRVDELVRLGMEEQDEAKCLAYYDELQQIIYDELPIIPLYYGNLVTDANVDLQGFRTRNDMLIYLPELSW